MDYIANTTQFYSPGISAVTLGKFDGLHRGHQKLIREILRLQRDGLRGIVFTIAPETNPALLTDEEKRRILEGFGVDCMIRCPFVPEILHMEPETFVSEILVRGLQAKYIVVGTDFRFGCNRSGDVELLRSLQGRYGYTLVVVEKECFGEREISSTYIREALGGADMGLVQELLGSSYPMWGIVQHGRQLGRRIGMPTINLVPEERKLLPPPGVYFSDVMCGGTQWHGVTNIGFRPTVDGSFLGVETYLYDVRGELYGREVQVGLRQFCRPERRFGSVEELRAQMERDLASGKEYFIGA